MVSEGQKSVLETFCLLNHKSLPTENTFCTLTKTYSILGKICFCDLTTLLSFKVLLQLDGQRGKWTST